jgi:signal transduction histidine kinase
VGQVVDGMGGQVPGVGAGELETTNATLRAVIDGIADPVYAKDAEGRYLLVNPAAASATELARARAGLAACRVTVRLEGGRLQPAVEIALFRVAQQALANVAEHAGATEVEVRLEQSPAGEVVLAVSDDGRGFDPAEVAGGGGLRFGLTLMAERVEALGGRLAVRARDEGGTVVEARVPEGRAA